METGLGILRGNLAQLAAKLTAEAEELKAPSWYAAGLRNVTHDALGALEAVDTARGALASAASDPNTSDKLKAARLADALNLAEGSARSYVTSATTALGGLKLELDRRLVPARPEGVTEAAVLDRKADLTALLDQAETPAEAAERAVALAKTAVAEGDSLTYHALAGGALRFYFERRGIDRQALAERLATVSPAPAAKLQGRFKGAESIPALVTLASHAVDIGLQELGATYRPMINSLNARAAKAAVGR